MVDDGKRCNINVCARHSQMALKKHSLDLAISSLQLAAQAAAGCLGCSLPLRLTALCLADWWLSFALFPVMLAMYMHAVCCSGLLAGKLRMQGSKLQLESRRLPANAQSSRCRH